MSTTARPRPARTSLPVGTADPPGRATGFRERLDRPVATYYLLLGTMSALVLIGLVMVLSASSITSYKQDGSSYAVFLNQLRFALLGAVAATVASRISPTWWKRLTLPALLGGMMLQLLVFTPLGDAQNGNRNWIRVGSFTMQPSELVKLGLILAGALILTRKRSLLGSPLHAVVPYVVPVALVAIGLVLAGNDLGTGFVLFGVVAGVLFVAGVPARLFAGAGVAVVLITSLLVKTSANRLARLTNWLNEACTSNPDGLCGQSVHGSYALADGGWWGVGLGASKEKWAWLSEAHNDFIFAIIGEELGLPGTLTILVLFLLLGYACYRLVQRSEDQFVRIASGGVMTWILIQSIINIGAVVGLLPVIGVPLPLVSAGGSSLVTTMLGFGMLLSFARREPGAEEWFSARVGLVRQSLAFLPARRSRRRS